VVIEHAVVGIGVVQRVMRLGVPVHEDVLMAVIVALSRAARRGDEGPDAATSTIDGTQPSLGAMVYDRKARSRRTARTPSLRAVRAAVWRCGLRASLRTASTCPTAWVTC
jgi:hypothetical protein